MTMFSVQIHNGLGGRYRRTSTAGSLWALTASAFEHSASALLICLERARQRRLLLGLGDRALQDFGANRCDATGEGDKPFWRS